MTSLYARLRHAAMLLCVAALPLTASAQLAFISNDAAGADGIDAYNPNGSKAYSFTLGFSGGTHAMAMDSAGVIYAAHSTSIDRFAQSGAYLGSFTSSNLVHADGLAFDVAGNLYVADSTLNLVQRYAPNGSFLGTFASGLHAPAGLAFDSAGNLYVANDTASNVQRFSASGSNLGVFISGLTFPTGLAFDASGNLYVGNYDGGHGGSTLREYNAGGSLIRSLGSGNFNVPYGVTISAAGNIYVTDTLFNRVLAFAPNGSSLGGYGGIDNATAILFPSAVPEPASAWLCISGLVALLQWGKGRKRPSQS